MLKGHTFIRDKLFGQYEQFNRYCKESGKKCVDELDSADFIAYRAEYAVPRAQIIQLQDLLDYSERHSVRRPVPPQTVSNKVNDFVFVGRAVPVDDNELTARLPDLMTEELFDATVEELASERNCPVEIVRTKLSKTYTHSEHFFHRGNLTVNLKCAYVLKERFPNGYKVDDESFYLRFVRYMQELFNEREPPNRRALDSLIRKIGVLCDRNKYLHPDRVRVPSEVINRVKKFIDASACKGLFYKTIFKTLKNSLVGTPITNHYLLEGVMRQNDLPYTFDTCCLNKTPGVDIGQEFSDFVAARGEVSAQEIKENFAAGNAADIDFLLSRSPEVIRAGNGTFIHASSLTLRQDDFESMRKFIRRNCSTPVRAQDLFDDFFEHFADFMRRNDIQSHEKFFGVMKYMFHADFKISRSYISPKGTRLVDSKTLLLDRFASSEEIAIEDVVETCAGNGIRFHSVNHLIDSLSPAFIRVDEFTLRRPESIGVTDKLIGAVAERLRSAVKLNDGWQAVQVFNDYEWLPRPKTPWNKFLLEGLAALADNAPYRLKNPARAKNWSGTVFVSDKFVGDDFKSFLQKVLSAEHEREPFQSEAEIFKWLKIHGLCNKTLPKFLANGKAFDFLSKGRIGELHVCLRMGQRYGRL